MALSMRWLDQLKTLFRGRNAAAPSIVRTKVNIRKRFELLREAICGTMSKFYMARDRDSGQIVGLKVLDPEKTAAFEARFKGLKKPSEGEITSRFDHPNIVKTLEYGTTSEGEHYLVMEYIDGPGLNSLLIGENRPLLEGVRLPLIRQIAEALKHVHDRGFIHRDISPRNLIVDTQQGILKLIDFGLTIPDEPAFLQPGNRTGNPNYMAPELVRRKRTDKRVDVFAFGVTIYELCTFELPWARGTTGKAAMDHACYPPQDIRELRPQIHPKLAKAIHHCLEQDVEQRCASMDDFLNQIRNVPHEDAA
jgi:serine/threonine-protein kinase